MTKIPRDTLWEMNAVNFLAYSLPWVDLPGGSDGKESACNVGYPGSIPGQGRSGEGHGNPVFLPGDSHGQRCLVGCISWGHKELDMTE